MSAPNLLRPTACEHTFTPCPCERPFKARSRALKRVQHDPRFVGFHLHHHAHENA